LPYCLRSQAVGADDFLRCLEQLSNSPFARIAAEIRFCPLDYRKRPHSSMGQESSAGIPPSEWRLGQARRAAGSCSAITFGFVARVRGGVCMHGVDETQGSGARTRKGGEKKKKKKEKKKKKKRTRVAQPVATHRQSALSRPSGGSAIPVPNTK